ncbi:DUF3489 domain-containing protein [Dankookia sp. P2]|uniref:DUF3489 domain-containing protein n=1 Tax=Dankookia sp. P2 TaxID=3423955 RepID=UPI003D670A84
MALSDTARRILAEAAQHPLRRAAPPDKLPTAAARAVLSNLLKQGYVEECEASRRVRRPALESAGRHTARGAHNRGGDGGNRCRACRHRDGGRGQGRRRTDGARHAPPTRHRSPVARRWRRPRLRKPWWRPPTPRPPSSPPRRSSARPNLRDAARRALAAWDDEVGGRIGLQDAIATLRAILVKPAPAPRSAGPRKPREGTKQQQVLALLRRPEGATVAQIMAATGWQAHTVRGLFAGLKKRQGLSVEAAERVRQVGPGKEGAKGSYTVYRIAEAG